MEIVPVEIVPVEIVPVEIVQSISRNASSMNPSSSLCSVSAAIATPHRKSGAINRPYFQKTRRRK